MFKSLSSVTIKLFVFVTVLVSVLLAPTYAVFAADPRCSDAAFLSQNTNNGVCMGNSINAGGEKLTNLSSVIIRIQNILNLVIPFLVGLAVFVIIYGIFGYIQHAADEEKRTEARGFILWGVVGIFLMLSIWGLVTILINTFNLDNSQGIIDATYPAGYVPPLPEANATIVDLIARATAIGPYIISLLIGIAVYIVIYGIFQYIREGDNEEKRAEGRMFIIWGVVGIFLMLSVWGLVNIMIGTFKVDNSIPPIAPLPTLPTS